MSCASKCLFYSDALFCFGHKKKKSMEKRANLKQITVKKFESLYHKERIAPVTLNLKVTFSPIALYKKRKTGAIHSHALFETTGVNRCRLSFLKCEGSERAKSENAKPCSSLYCTSRQQLIKKWGGGWYGSHHAIPPLPYEGNFWVHIEMCT